MAVGLTPGTAPYNPSPLLKPGADNCKGRYACAESAPSTCDNGRSTKSPLELLIAGKSNRH